jgi:hypothetical protein
MKLGLNAVKNHIKTKNQTQILNSIFFEQPGHQYPI